MEFIAAYSQYMFGILVVGILFYLLGVSSAKKGRFGRAKMLLLVALLADLAYFFGAVLIMINFSGNSHIFGVLIGALNAYFVTKALGSLPKK